MNLIGQKVNHFSRGSGTVVKMLDEGHFIVEFPDKESQFQYPQAFEKFLTAEDDKIQADIVKDLEDMKAAAEAEKAAKAAAAEAARLAQDAAKDKKGTSAKKYVPIRREEGQALTFLVFQGATFKEESEGSFIWAPQNNIAGGTCHYWDSLMDVREGDIILNCDDGYIKAVSRAMGSFVECVRPIQYSDDVNGFWSSKGRKVECEYTLIKNPIRTSDYRDDILKYCNVKYAPFDKNGNGNMGYLYQLDSKLASIFLQASADQNPELNDLDYISWLLQ